jgi:hypothetical protein
MAVDLDLILQTAAPQCYRADIRVHLDSQGALVSPLGAPVPVPFDLVRLRELALDPAAYGAALSGMLFASSDLREGFAQARAVAAQRGLELRLRLTVGPGAEDLHALRWETIADPLTPDQPLAVGSRVLFSRTLSSADWQIQRQHPQHPLRALVLVAAPSDLSDYGLAPISAARKIAQIQMYLGNCQLTALGAKTRASLSVLYQHLLACPDVLVLLAHGRVDEMGQTWLYLEDEQGRTDPVPGHELVTRIGALAEKPRLIVLGCCDSSGDGSRPTLASLGPQLVQAGVSSVLAMQDLISQKTLSQFLQTCFQTLQEGEPIERAVAVARAQVRSRPDWWVPTLFMRLADGCACNELLPASPVSPWAPRPSAPQPPPASMRSGPAVLSLHQRADLLNRLSLRYHRRLENTLAREAQLRAGLHTRPDAVDPLWRRLHLRDSVVVRRLPPSVPPLEIFDAQEGQLLVLGAPGAGKTLLIVELAQALTDRALADPYARIPVLLNVSAWRSGQTLREWLPAALRDALGTSKRFAVQLAHSDELLLLLDGLDEVAAEHRAACVRAINGYLRERDLAPPLVVGCRSRVYTDLGAKLQIAGAIELEPLNLAVVERILADLPEAQGVLEGLQADPLLRELATSPLMMGVLLLAHSGQAVPLIQSQSLEERRRVLWATYVRRMFIQRPLERPWSTAQVLRWLRWLARHLRAESVTNFLTDDLQPTMLPSNRLRFCYRGLSGLVVGLTIGLPTAVVSMLLSALAFGFARGLIEGLHMGLVSGLFISVLSGLRSRLRIRREEQITWSGMWFRRQLGHVLVGSLLFGLLFGLTFDPTKGVVLGLVAGLGLTLNAGWQSADLPVRPAPMQSIRPSFKMGLIYAFPWIFGGILGLGWARFPEDVQTKVLSVEPVFQQLGLMGHNFMDGLVAVLMGGLFGGLGGRLVNGLPPGWHERELTVCPARGQSQRAACYARLMSVLPWFLGGLLGWITGVSMVYVLVGVLLTGLNIGLLVALNTLIQHYTLRLVLTQAGLFPARVVTFLEAMSARLLLERDGPIFRFRHLLLRDFFADLTDEDIDELVRAKLDGG